MKMSNVGKRSILLIMLVLTLEGLSAQKSECCPAPDYTESNATDGEHEDGLSRNLFIEFGGPSECVGLGYDQRFKPGSVFGFRAGVALSDGSFNDGLGVWGARFPGEHTKLIYHGVSLPFEVNAIMGKRASKLELGVGATPCVLNRNEEKYVCGWDENLNWFRYTLSHKEGLRLNIFGTINIGYRLQRKSGFFMRTGLTFLFGELKSSPIDGRSGRLNLSLGYTI